MSDAACILCIDTESMLHPGLLGLEDEMLISQPWIKIITDAQEARDYVRSLPGSVEAWVVGSDEMEGINLGAALKRDRPDAKVDLISFDPNGSLFSRARVAGISEVMDKKAFLEKYESGKRSFAKGLMAAALPTPQSQTIAVGRARSEERPQLKAEAPESSKPSPQLAQSIASDVTAVMQRVSRTSADAFVLSVAGAGGGTGKSAIAALCGCFAHAQGRKTVILDADLQFGDIAYLCGCESPLCVDELAEAPLRIESLSPNGAIPPVVAAPRYLERSEVAADCFSRVLAMLRQRFDVVIVNTGSTWSDVHLQLLEESTHTLFVLDQRPSSIRTCKHALGLCSRCGIATTPFLFALNRCARKALFSGNDISCALQGARVFELKDGGRAVEERLGTGNPPALFEAKNPLAESVVAMMGEILPDKGSGGNFLVGGDDARRKRGIRRKGKL